MDSFGPRGKACLRLDSRGKGVLVFSITLKTRE